MHLECRCPCSFTYTDGSFRICLFGAWRGIHLVSIVLWNSDWAGLVWGAESGSTPNDKRPLSFSPSPPHTPAHTQIPTNYNAFGKLLKIEL